MFSRASVEGAGSLVILSGQYSLSNELADTLSVRIVDTADDSGGEYLFDVAPSTSCGLATSVSGTSRLELRRANGASALTGTLSDLQSQWIQLGEGWVCLNVSKRRVFCTPLDEEPHTKFVWATCTTLQVIPAVLIVNSLPLPIEVKLDGAETASSVGPHGERVDLLCDSGPADQEEEIRIHTACDMHKFRYATTEASCVHGSAELTTQLSLFSDSRPCLHLTVHYAMVGLARVIHVCTSHVLVNTSGLPLRILAHGDKLDGDGEEQGLRVGRTDEADHTAVSEWIHPQQADDVTILPVPLETKKKATLFRLAVDSLCSKEFNVDNCNGMLELTHAGVPSRQVAVTNQREDMSSVEAAAWRDRLALKPPPFCRTVRLFPWLLFGNHLDCGLELVQWCDGDGDDPPEEARTIGTLESQSTSSIDFPAAEHGKPKHVRMRTVGGAEFSHPTRVDLVGEFAVWLPGATAQAEEMLVRISVKSMDATMFFHVQHEHDTAPLFRVQNKLTGTAGGVSSVSIRQNGCSATRTIEAGESRAVGRDDPSQPRQFLLGIGQHEVECNPEDVGFTWQEGNVSVTVVVEGTTRAIVVDQSEGDSGDGGDTLLQEGVPAASSKTVVSFPKGLGLSLVTAEQGVCSEAVVVTLGNERGCSLSIEMTPSRMCVEISVDSVEIDSMLPEISPVVLQSVFVDESKPAVHIAAVVRLDTVAD
eukprot:COSAG06_NODE_8610_length_2116_cov_1.225087_1_plen_704_part_11